MFFATLLTLFLVPALLMIVNDQRRVAYYTLYKRWPSMEEVEPGTQRKFHLYDEEDEDGAPVAEGQEKPMPELAQIRL